MKFSKIKLSVTFAVALMVASCGGSEKKQVGEQGLRNESDSLAYIIGLSMAQNLQQIDSTINLEAVSLAIAHAARGEARMSESEARTAYLKYMLYIEPQRRRAYEDKYLEELSKSDSIYVRSKSGLTFHITDGGNSKNKPIANTDWVEYTYSINRVDGESVAENIKAEMPMEDIMDGIQECIKMLGVGGKIEAWIPSKLTYADAGNKELKIAPFETLHFYVELVSVEPSTVEKNRKRASKF